MTKKTDKPIFAANTAIATFRYRGPDRRQPPTDAQTDGVDVEIRFDDKGNPVWEMRTAAPGRREDDDTFDLLKCLDIDSLSIDDGQGLEPDQDDTNESGYDPYGRIK